MSDGDSVGPVQPVSAVNRDKEGSAASDETPSSILSCKIGKSRQEHSSASLSAVSTLSGYLLYASSAANL